MSIFKPETPKLLQTEDGSHTLHLESIDETYHSHAGALTESVHVYINNGLKLLQNLNTIKILEVGFGTGMNAILTLLENQNDNKKIIYHSLEPYPIPLDLVAHLDMGDISKDSNSATFHPIPKNAS
jgi:tRNA U34 5-methylaminomethyl-2-thiouridine-forming methyltransferase MnmC